LGISGGIDSTTLLFVLLEIQKTIDFELGLAHINHMLRGKESERDEEFVRELAGRLCLPLYVERVHVKEIAVEKGLSIQHAGREARYSFFNGILRQHGYNKIAIAHNLDDQIETFLLRAMKGTGLKGLSSIPIKRDAIIRPLLNTYRTDIAEYAARHAIAFVEDSSNSKTVYERNYVRNEDLT
jgi:tRNA(Ile)-lysidine synthase